MMHALSRVECFTTHKSRPDKFREECGVFGVYAVNESSEFCNIDVSRVTYYGLYALQHRGQESAGIAVCNKGTILHHKDMGLVPEIFDDVVLNHLKGNIAIGHVRYSTTGASMRENAQPLVVKYRKGQFALAHNGNLVNSSHIREKLEENGAVFQTTIDSEVIANVIAKNRLASSEIEDAICMTMNEIKGSYALVIMTSDKLIGVRDPHGIRPLCIGTIDGGYVIASETCAIDAVGAKFLRDVEPGEIVVIDNEGVRSVKAVTAQKTSLCIFEYVYFARPDSFIDGASVQRARLEAGRRLAIEHPVEADLVIGAPDSGLTAAIGFSRESGIPLGQGLIKNRYVGRTFIQPEQGQRENGVRIKFNSMKDEIKGKRIVMIDDSIVRGTTTKRIVQILKESGATEVHMRVSSPPVKFPCFFGIDTPSRKQLVASSHSVEEIRKMIGADSLGYLSLEGLLATPVGVKCGLCTACFCGNYPMEVPYEASKLNSFR